MQFRLWEAYPGFNKQSSFSTWLYRVAINTAIDIIRKQIICPSHTQLTKIEYNIPEQENIGSDKKDALYEAINLLQPLGSLSISTTGGKKKYLANSKTLKEF